MEYSFVITDEKLSFEIVEGRTNSTGLNAILKKVCGLRDRDRRAFMQKLLDKKQSEHKADREGDNPYSVFAQYVGDLV
uniref:Uncharacterized protein n=1 Tax=Gordonia phage Petito TaxID=3158876 RepID=A0AAU8GR44_9CAUD